MTVFRDESAFLGKFDKNIYLCPCNQRYGNMKTTAKITSGAATFIHSIVIPVFVLVFTLYYRPYGIFDILDMENASFTFNMTIMFCIILVSLSITRGWLYLLGKYKSISAPVYLIWSLGEILVASLFCSLYFVLMSKEMHPFYEVAGASFMRLVTTSIYPYAFIWLGFELYSRNQEDAAPSDDSSLIRFYDEYKKLRLVIAPEAVIFIKSEDNYVQIHYVDQGRTRKFVLRSSMRALEDNLSKHGLVRCHRSYFINPAYIKIVHRDSAGLIVAELNQDGYESIPISRKYQDAVTRLL